MAKRKSPEQRQREHDEQLASLVGRTITEVSHDKTDEGVYQLTLDDGRRVYFSACGDDMTYTTFAVLN